ncbi:hypothetical protein [Ancylomarina longa]|uniref:Uncharacterized protein n=1 Tax=Ancylomarina longa TaxID=2487017 RepID=A0A434ATM8_9BACT|nr:hypothetical protein [Ancylomarina longa]RUT77773.1 hypothetical protein DLK05_11245 [Ancylomarina longa]
MDQSQMNRKHMIEATVTYLDENATIWQSIAKIGEVKNKIGNISLAINDAAELQSDSKVTMGKVKLTLKRTICEKADIVNDIVEVYAVMNSKDKLAGKMADSASDLFKMKNDDMLRRVKLIIGKATDLQEPLAADYGLNTEQVSDLKADYDHFLELNGQPREYQIKSSMATHSLEELFTEANDLLSNQLDNLIKIFKRRDANFYHGYLKARMVVDY